MSVNDDCFSVLARCAASISVGGSAIVSYDSGVDHSRVDLIEKSTLCWAGRIEFIEQSDQELCDSIEQGEVQRLRFDGSESVPESVRRVAPKHFVFIAEQPVLSEDFELFWYVIEQSISFDYHRYGNLGPRAEEPRTAVH